MITLTSVPTTAAARETNGVPRSRLATAADDADLSPSRSDIDKDLSTELAAGDDQLLAATTGGFSVFSDVARPLRHLSIEQLKQLGTTEGEVFRVRLARPRPLTEDTAALIARRYASRGYETPRQAVDPNTYTFAAYDSGELVGTVSLRFDSACGLMAEHLYPQEIADLRARDHHLCEFTRLALDEQATSKEVLAALFHTCYLYAHWVRRLSHAVIEVNPRHVAFYRRVLFFRQIGEERHNPRVDAPAVLLELDFQRITDHLERFCKQPDWQQSSSFFAHAFSPKDAAGVLARLQRLDEERTRGTARDL